jgi:hypothetical protein
MGIFRVIKQVMTGEIVQQIDSTANGGAATMSLRLKRDRRSGDHYVVLAGTGPGNYQYFAFDKDEFERFSFAVEAIQSALKQAGLPRT